MIKIVMMDGIPFIILAEGIIEFKSKSSTMVKGHNKKRVFTYFQRQKETQFMKKLLSELKRNFANKKQ